MPECSLAVDIGASSGKMLIGYIEKGKLNLKEIHRFENKIIKKNQHFCWDLQALFSEILTGIHASRNQGFTPKSIGIDTWAVDFVLLDEQDRLLTDAVSYRDPRTDGMMEEIFQKISKERLYLETGIQFQKFNTIYQLYYLKKHYPEILDRAKSFLMIPDYLNYLLTGIKANEYTNATSTQLVNAFTKKWDKDLLDQLRINKEIFQEILPPKSILGNLKPELSNEIGFDMNVLLPATHDTGSAVASVPESADTIYISSGTWSLIGVENNFPICVTKALDYNFTNEGGVDYRFRFLKNTMGLWMIQEVKRIYNNRYTFAELAAMANQVSGFYSQVNVDDDRFLKPENMVQEIQNYCEETNQPIPNTPEQVAKCVFDSLAESYQMAINQIEEIYEKEFKRINVIGGGSQNEMLNQLIADTTGKEVLAGPSEATAIGNLITQLMALGQIQTLDEARQMVKNSFEMKAFTSKNKTEGLK
ncbi:rhamnulokinase [Oceanobacillus timonensis]|uniref:rhamnulokinase n=1 Tax=Oceanobacillus timonensis TaxID=1926285 RepID=UPI0009BC486D|nr:rhamnulokinase [Oceanobacillus timonensis]